jgi:Mycotoxin biosynthesis protein UstYa
MMQNAVRIALAQDYYREILDASHFDPVEGSYGRDHISHCLDAVREAVMCASDISVITWKWNKKAQKALGHGDIIHSCRSFENIQDWAIQNRAIVDFQAEVYVEDEMSDPSD